MNNLFEKVKINARSLKIMATSLSGAAIASSSIVFATSGGAAGSLVKSLLGYVFAIFKYIGWLLLAWGVGQLVLAFKNEDADSKSRAMMLIVSAIILTSIGTIFNGIMGMDVKTDVNI